ncbi:MAG: methylmalonyl-CoA epimerase [Dehalococcoidia bacterium]
MISRLHHVAVVVPDADAALTFYRDTMGLTVTGDEVIEEQGVRGVLLEVGENEIELIQPVRDDTGVARFLESRGPTLHHYCFATDNIDGELARIKGLEVELIDQAARRGLAGQVAFIHPRSMNGVLVELAEPPAGTHVSSAKGFDHLAVRTSDPAALAASWERVLGVRVAGRLGPFNGTLIDQVPCGQCTIELLSPATPDAPIAQQIAEQGQGAVPMVAIEVQDLDAEIARYRAAGIEMPDAAPSLLPNARMSSVPASAAFGMAIQLISYTR